MKIKNNIAKIGVSIYFIFIFIIVFFVFTNTAKNNNNLEQMVNDQNNNFLESFVDTGMTNSSENTNIKLDNWDIDIKILENGNLNISEKWEANYESITTMFRTFGREVKDTDIEDPKVYLVKNEEEKVLLKRNTLKEKQDKGYYHYGYYNGRLEIGWGIDKDKSKDIYIIEYTLLRAAYQGEDYSSIFHRVISDNSLKTKKVNVNISHKNHSLTKENTLIFGHGNPGFKISYINNGINISSDNGIDLGQMCEYRLIMPKSFLNIKDRGSFLEEIIEEEQKIYDVSLKYKAEEVGKYHRSLNIATILYILIIVFSLNLFYYLFNKTRKYNRIKKLREEKITKFKYYTEVPKDLDLDIMKAMYINNEYGESLFEMLKAITLKAIYLNILEMKVIGDSEKKKDAKDLIYIVNEEKYEEYKKKGMFSDFENLVLNTFVSKKDINNEITQEKVNKELGKKSDSIYKTYQKEAKKQLKELKEEGYIRNEKDEEKKNSFDIFLKSLNILNLILIIIMFFALIAWQSGFKGIASYDISKIINPIFLSLAFVINIIMFVILDINKNRNFTTKGMQVQNELEGFKKHLKDFSLIEEHDERGIKVWEKILIYAVIFGISKKVLTKLKKIYPDMYNNLNSYLYFNTFNNSAFIGNDLNTSGFSSGGSYGGFSGGGYGGSSGFGGGSGGGR